MRRSPPASSTKAQARRRRSASPTAGRCSAPVCSAASRRLAAAGPGGPGSRWPRVRRASALDGAAPISASPTDKLRTQLAGGQVARRRRQGAEQGRRRAESGDEGRVTKQLDQAVKDRHLTAAQKTKILAKIDAAPRRHHQQHGPEAAGAPVPLALAGGSTRPASAGVGASTSVTVSPRPPTAAPSPPRAARSAVSNSRASRGAVPAPAHHQHVVARHGGAAARARAARARSGPRPSPRRPRRRRRAARASATRPRCRLRSRRQPSPQPRRPAAPAAAVSTATHFSGCRTCSVLSGTRTRSARSTSFHVPPAVLRSDWTNAIPPVYGNSELGLQEPAAGPGRVVERGRRAARRAPSRRRCSAAGTPASPASRCLRRARDGRAPRRRSPPCSTARPKR